MDQGGEEAAADSEAELRQDHAGGESAENAEHHVSENAEAGATHQRAGDPAGKRADDEENDEAFDSHGGAPSFH